jgi:ATP-dependent DNA helicase RecG
MTKEELITRLQDIEWDDFEVKEAKSELPKSVWETVSAFCNSSGGWIVLGVSQQGKQYEVTGVGNAEKLEQDFFSALRSSKFNAILTAHAHKYLIEGKTVLAFFVTSSIQKPIYFNTPQNTFIRCGSGDQRATHSEISAMFREQSFGIRSELSIPDTKIELLNQDSLRSYRNYLNAYNSLAAYPDLDNEIFCQKLGITNDKGLLTYAGLLMLGRREVIHRHVPTFWMDYIEIPGKSVQEAKTRYTYRIPEQENLWEYYHVIIKRLRLLVDTPFRMNVDGFAVDDDSQLNVLREALVNMLMHTDHFSSIHSCIRVYTNRVEFMNAGGFHIPIERLSTSMMSKPRNPSIAKLFRFAKLSENVGFGIDKLKSWKQLTGYSVDIHSEIDYATITFGIKDTVVDEDSQNVNIVNDDKDGVNFGVNFGVNATQEKIIKIMIVNPNIKPKKLPI